MVAEWVFPVIQYILGVLGGVAVGVLIVLLHRLRTEDALASFRKLPLEAQRDFRWITFASTAMFASFTVYAIGGYYELPVLLVASRLIEMTFFVLMIGIFVRWWRRFQ